MKRRTLVKLSSLFAVTSIFSASVSMVGTKKVDAQQCQQVDSSFSCAQQIDKVFQSYELKVISFDIQYADSRGNCYRYAFDQPSNKSMEKDEQPSLLSPKSLEAHPTFDNSERLIAQKLPLATQVYNSIKDAMTQEGVYPTSMQFDTIDPNGERCTSNPILYPHGYGSAPQ